MDRLTKPAHFLVVQMTFTLEEFYKLYIREIVRLHGVPICIVSDRCHARRRERLDWDSLLSLSDIGGSKSYNCIKNIVYKIQNTTTTRVVSIKIYTHILSPMYIYKHLYIYMSNTDIRDRGSSAGEHLSLR